MEDFRTSRRITNRTIHLLPQDPDVGLDEIFFMYDVNRDVVSQLPPDECHPPFIVASLKKLAYDMNDASSTLVENPRQSTV